MDENPYVSPQEVEPVGGRADTAQPGFGPAGFVPATGRARIAMAMLGLNVLAWALLSVFCLFEAALLSRVISGVEFADLDPAVKEALSIDAGVRASGRAADCTHLLAVIAFLAWLHRTCRNLPALGADKLEFSPGWAIGCWFVPILNLFRPYQVVREAWLASNPECAGEANPGWRGGPTSPLLKFWWAAFILMRVGDGVGRLFLKNHGIRETRTASYILAARGAVCIIAGVLAILVVRAIDRRQQEAYAKITDPQFMPPVDTTANL